MRLTDDWAFYACELDEDVPGMIMVDLGGKDQAPQADKAICLEVTIPFLDPADNGFPTNTEAPTLYELEDRAEELFSHAVYVGRVTGQGKRELYFYLATEDGIGDALRALNDAFPDYDLEAGTIDDPEWKQYLGLLYPGVIGLRYITNLRAVSKLEQQGDPIGQERPVHHTARFPEEEPARKFGASFGAEDWIELDGVEQEGDAWVVRLTAQHGIQLEEINEVTYPMAGVSDELGGAYEGWTCEIPRAVTPEAAAAFWTWFQSELPRLTGEIAERVGELVSELSDKLEEVAEGVGAVIGPGPPHELVVTAHGNKDLARAVEDIVADAPELEGWFVTAFRPPEEVGAEGDGPTIRLDNEELGLNDVHFLAFRGPSNELGITLCVRGLDPQNHEQRATAAVILMDHIVGERACFLIDSLEFEALAEVEASGLEPTPLRKLGGLLEQVRLERFGA